ncbi:MAG: hypothetical protein LBJ02_11025 [Bifidobacteriaceae bacterium]|jgi:surface-anchored protein|nr:hypothetical protein [Bifidobacteriaceae bacterium]
MTTGTKRRESALANRKTIGASLLAGVGALAVALGAPLAAQALSGVVSEGDLDVIEVEAAESSPGVWDVELVGHDHGTDTEFDPADVTYEVTAVDGVGYIAEGEALSAGFSAGDEDFLADLQGGDVTFTLASASRSGSTTGSGNVEIYDGKSIDIAFNADSYGTSGSEDFVLSGHTHPDWEFHGQGTYTLVFTVSATPNPGITVNGLPDNVTVTVEVI